MKKDQPLHGVAKALWAPFERMETRGHPRTRTFEEWLEIALLAHLSRTDNISRERMDPATWDGPHEEAYKTLARRYDEGEKGQRPIDLMAEAHAQLLLAIVDDPGSDPLGEVFMQRITWGEHGQFFTPRPLCEAMAKMVMGDCRKERPTVNDPACGSGRMLIAAAQENPRAVFFGQDVDLRCCRMTVLNLLLRGLQGCVTWGDALANESRREWTIAGGFVVEREGHGRPVPIIHDVEPRTQLVPAAQGDLLALALVGDDG